LEGIFGECGEGIQVDFRKGCFLAHNKSNPIDWAVFESESADVTVACMGLTQMIEGEEGDALASSTSGDRLDLRLPESQRILLEKLCEGETPIVLVLTGGSPIDLTDYIDRLDAVLYLWYPGERGGKALANVLFGNISPSGKLPITFPGSARKLPAFQDYSMVGRTYKFMKEEPQFPFGFGLSYSTFNFSDIQSDTEKLTAKKDLTISFSITNTGLYTADEVVQIYLRKIIDGEPTTNSELVDFSRVSLSPGDSMTLSFTIPSEMFKIVNFKGEREYKCGKCLVYAGNSSPGKRAEELGASFSVKEIQLK
jgi:beta-glucosidase